MKMSAAENLNCLKNLIQLVCCDGKIHPREKTFLYQAAKELAVTVEDWNALLKEVLRDETPFYPIENREKAIAALKAMIALAKADGRVDAKEKQLALQFAKSLGVSKTEWKQIIGVCETDGLLEPFSRPDGQIVAIRDDFDQFDAFLKTARQHSVTVHETDFKSHLI